MRLHVVPARQGAHWVRRGFRVFFLRPLAFAGLLAVYMVALALAVQLPGIGGIVFSALLPLGSLGFMIATREALEGRMPTPKVFVTPLRGDKARRNALIRVGIAYVVGTFLVSELSNIVDGGVFERMVEAFSRGAPLESGGAKPLAGDTELFAVTLRLALVALLSIPFWHAPALVHWDGHGWGKALFSSTAACWSNRGAFLVFGLAWAGVVLVVGTLMPLLFVVFGGTRLFAFIAAPVSLLLSTVFYISLYFTFVDSFSAGEPPAAVAPTLGG